MKNYRFDGFKDIISWPLPETSIDIILLIYNMSISEISLYKALRTKLGDETADELVEFVKSETKTELQAKTDTFLTKVDKIDLIEKMNKGQN